MKLPRDLTGKEPVQKLACLGYQVERQTGSHARMVWKGPKGERAIPLHRPLKVGTLAGIPRAVTEARGMGRKALERLLEL
ncbi:type II toxin-antitoxin system HicA family toxin [Thermus sediminis]|uniref:type II toxin-antitoxin system HicA family toxin n=1 Tax=Thermus sediminis TaxID=1761908 RepID=UPI000E3DEF9B|nr:type II toxin-antitoxin system HicA family toxin [Thermus sediminis]